MAKEKTTYDLFLSSNGEVRQCDWQELVQSLVTYGDSVWLPSHFEISPMMEDSMRKEIDRALRDMIDAKLIRLWSLGGTNAADDSGVDKIVLEDIQDELKDEIDDSVMSNSSYLVQGTKDQNEIDTASRVIEVRHELWNMGLATVCDADGIVYGQDIGRSGNDSPGSQYENVSRQYTKVLFEQFGIPDMTRLRCEDILDLRSKVAFLRRRVDELITGAAKNEVDEATILKECQALYKEYLKVTEGALRQRASLIDSDTVMSVVGMALPVVGVVPVAKRIYMWMRERDKYRFTFYMHRIKQLSAK